MFKGYEAKLIVPAVAAVVLALAGVAGSVPQKPTGDLVVKIASEGEMEWNECSIFFRHGAGTVEKGKKTFLFSGVPAGTYTVIAEATGERGTRLFAAAKAGVKADGKSAVTVTLSPAEGTDAFCSACHPTRDEPLGRGQIVRDIHRSGTVLPKGHAEKVTAYNRETETLKKKGETKRLPMPVEEREVLAGGKKVKETIFTCESCHTFHQETPYPSYVRASYRQGGELCTGCHP